MKIRPLARKLSHFQVNSIIARYHLGLARIAEIRKRDSQAALAREFRVSKRTIEEICRPRVDPKQNRALRKFPLSPEDMIE